MSRTGWQMRRKVEAKYLKPGMIAFLPYYGKLRKSKINNVGSPYKTKTGEMIQVTYRLVYSPYLKNENMSFLTADKLYEVYYQKRGI